MTSAFAAGEARWLREPDRCERCHREPMPGYYLCAGCDDDAHDYAKDAADEREERAAARGRDCL